MFLIVSYDIREAKRLTRVAKVLLDFGERVQYSVFECDLTEEQLKTLRARLQRTLNPSEDSVRFYPICESCLRKTTVLGQGATTRRQDVYVV